MEIPCTQAGKGLYHPKYKRGLGRKKARVAFQSKALIELVFHH